jgi:hypothetical protein
MGTGEAMEPIFYSVNGKHRSVFLCLILFLFYVNMGIIIVFCMVSGF